MAEKITIARPYAQAIFNMAREQGKLQGWSEMLQLAAAVAGDSGMAALIHSPRVTQEQLVKLFLSICGDKLNDAGRQMVQVLAENKRLELLPEIAALYEIARASAEGTLEAEVISAAPLADAQKDSIAKALKARLGREVTLNCTIDQSLLGGAIIRAGDLVIDGSAVGKLNRLSAELLH